MAWKILLISGLLLLSSVNSGLKQIIMEDRHQSAHSSLLITLFLCGDVMTGRGIDQALPNSVNPKIYEGYVKDARDYLHLAEKENGPIHEPVSYSYIWGDALKIWKETDPDIRIINLETSITDHDEPWPRKGINYRMHPKNIKVLTAADIDYCALANNHTLDWGHTGLIETLETLKEAGIEYSGAGRNLTEAGEPAILKTPKGRVIIFSYGTKSSGIPDSWSAKENSSGVNLLENFYKETVNEISQNVKDIKKTGDVVVFSIHWGGNWGYDIPGHHREFAHQLINAGVDIIYGHSSHHPRGIEVYQDKLIIYGAGDFINDYEGISGHDQYRDDLTLMYFPKIDLSTGDLVSMKMVPMQIKNFRLNHVDPVDAKWLHDVLDREAKKSGARIIINEDYTFSLHWNNSD